MRDTERFLPPRNPALRWLAEIGPELSPEIQSRLRSTFLLSRGPLVCGSLNSVAVALVAAHRSGEAAFLALALGDLILLGFRLLALRRTAASSGPVFATGLIWAGLQGAAIALVVASADQAMSLVVLASGLAGYRLGRPIAETDRIDARGPEAMRGGTENLVLDAAVDGGLHGVSVRFAPTVHGAGDHGFDDGGAKSVGRCCCK